MLFTNMNASSYIDILRDDIYVHSFDEDDCPWPSAVALYTQQVQDAFRLPAWVKSVGKMYIISSIRHSFDIIHRDPILSSRSVHVHFSKSCVPLTLICTRTYTSPRVQRRTCTGGSKLPSGSRSAIAPLSVVSSMKKRSMECFFQSSRFLLSSFGIYCCTLI